MPLMRCTAIGSDDNCGMHQSSGKVVKQQRSTAFMNPFIEFRVSWVHNLTLDAVRYLPKQDRPRPKYSPSDAEALRKRSNDFVRLFARHSSEILRMIPEKTGFEWRANVIPVYLSDTTPNSYEDPLTVKYSDDPAHMLIDLIHELIHCNIPSSVQEPLDDKDREQLVEVVNEDICKELGISSSGYCGFNYRHTKDFPRENFRTLREFLATAGNLHRLAT